MSSPINVKDVEALIDSLVRKGVAYAVALYPFLYSFDEDRYVNTVKTLEPAFGRDVAESIYRELSGAFSFALLFCFIRHLAKEKLFVLRLVVRAL